MRAEPPLLNVTDLRVRVGRPPAASEVVRGVSFELRRGEFLGIVGESGSGKTMTALSLMGLLPDGVEIASGSIKLDGDQLVGASRRTLDRVRGSRMAMVFQEPMTSLNPLMRVGRQVGESLVLHRMATRAGALRRAIEGLREVGIPDAEQRVSNYPHEYSGGMRQRAMTAAALIASPSLLIADEPTTALDVTVQAQILKLLRDLNRSHGNAVIFISHDLAVVARLCDRVAVMYAGRIVEIGSTEGVLKQPRHPYTRALLQALPDDTVRPRERLQAITGEPPNLEDLPLGCPFAARCPFATDRSKAEEPPLLEFGGARAACWQGDSLPPWGGRLGAG